MDDIIISTFILCVFNAFMLILILLAINDIDNKFKKK